MAEKRNKFIDDESSEKGKERKVMSVYQTQYTEFKTKIKMIRRYHQYAKIAKDSLEKYIDILRSIAKLIKSEEDKV